MTVFLNEITLCCLCFTEPILELILSSSTKSKLPSVKAILSTSAFDVTASNIAHNEPPKCKITTSTKEFLGRCRKTIEDRMHKEQNEVTYGFHLVRMSREEYL